MQSIVDFIRVVGSYWQVVIGIYYTAE